MRTGTDQHSGQYDEVLAHRRRFESTGFTIVRSGASPTLVRQVIFQSAEAPSSGLVPGDESDHSWSEIHANEKGTFDWHQLTFKLKDIVGSDPVAFVHWVNVYEMGQFIEGHFDAGGDAQLLIPIETPPVGQGGDIWVGDRKQTLKLLVGDVLVFRARQMRHGTTPVRAGRRISLNCRIWLGELN